MFVSIYIGFYDICKIDDLWNIDLDGKKTGRNKDIPKESLDEYYRVKKETKNLKSGVEELSKERSMLADDINRLQAEKSALMQLEDAAREKIDSIEKEREKLRKEQEETRALKEKIDEYAERLTKTNEELQEEIQDKRTELSAMEKQKKEIKESLDSLSEQVEEKLAIVDDELSPEFVHQMLNDSVTSNLVQETILKTCKQLEQIGYLKVEATTAFMKINKESILEIMKEHISDFLKEVKSHISKILLKRNKTYHKRR